MKDLESYLQSADIQLYEKILTLINRDLNDMNSERLSDLFDKLSELHQNLNQIILSKKRSELFTNSYFDYNFHRGRMTENYSESVLKSIYYTLNRQ